MTIKQALEKFGVAFLMLISSRKFWLWAVSVLGSLQMYVSGQITANVFLAAFISATVALIVSIMGEDIAKQHAMAAINVAALTAGTPLNKETVG